LKSFINGCFWACWRLINRVNTCPKKENRHHGNYNKLHFCSLIDWREEDDAGEEMSSCCGTLLSILANGFCPHFIAYSNIYIYICLGGRFSLVCFFIASNEKMPRR
jgi:hypothetical protein